MKLPGRLCLEEKTQQILEWNTDWQDLWNSVLDLVERHVRLQSSIIIVAGVVLPNFELSGVRSHNWSMLSQSAVRPDKKWRETLHLVK